jgi:beta-glucosidase/6-phospho-beta-glucosidase/beta-galactosidase
LVAFQIEGAANADGKGPSVWDLIPHRWANSIADNSTGDVGPNSYYYYKVDNARLQSLGIPAYSYSIGWPRVFPFGSGPVNQAGIQFYDNVIDDLISRNIVPIITLFHWDTPLALFNSYGAWTSENIVADYVRYAKFIISRYDQHVHAWVTFNEPQYCNWRFSNYPFGSILPSYNGIGKGGVKARFLCGHNTLLAHAEVHDWYRNVFKGTKPMTMKNSANYIIANSSSDADQEAVGRANDFNMGWFGQCWRDDGDYPQTLKDTLEPFGLLPKFTQEQKDKLKGSCEYYAVDAYTTYYAAAPPNGIKACTSNMTDPNFPDCAVTSSIQPNGFPIGPNADAGATWLYSTPVGIRKFLNFITKEYFPSVKSIQVTEFGFSDPDEGGFNTLPQILWDLRRADYIQGFLDNILAAKVIDGVNVTGIFGWAIYDNFEWNSGLSAKFGLQHVNLTSYERTPKASMFQFLNWFRTHGAQGITTIDNATMPLDYGTNN